MNGEESTCGVPEVGKPLPMAGLSAWLRATASTMPGGEDRRTILQWSQDVDTARGVPLGVPAAPVPSAEVWGVVHRETGAVDCVSEDEEGASYSLAEGYEKRKGIAYFPPPAHGVGAVVIPSAGEPSR